MEGAFITAKFRDFFTRDPGKSKRRPKMISVYLETSALLRMIFAEKEAPLVEKKIRTASRVVTSRLTRLETERAIIRLAFDKPDTIKVIPLMERELGMLWPKIDFIEITKEICELAARIAPKSRLRTLDAIHLATFLYLKKFDPKIEILTYDERLVSEL